MKKKIKTSYILGACVFIMALLCFLSIDSPIRFNDERTERENAVKAQLIKIRTAEKKYRAKNGVYTDNFDVLTKAGLLSDSARYIPYSDNKTFVLQVTAMTGKMGNQIPLMECSAGYKDYLDGLDKNSVNDLINEAHESGQFPGLKIGDLESPNNNAGNWE